MIPLACKIHSGRIFFELVMHTGGLFILSMVGYLDVDEANLSLAWKRVIKTCIPSEGSHSPVGFFFVPDANTAKPNALINLASNGVAFLVTRLPALGQD